MAKTVGFACSIRASWLDKAAQLYKEKLSEDDFKREMNEYLAFEIDSPTRLRKTREILMNIWYYEKSDISASRETASRLIEKDSEYSVLCHLGLMYLAYPVVADICKYMGRIFEFQEDITNTQLKKKLYDEWGERGSLETTSRRVTLTLKELGVLNAPTKTRYQLIKHKIEKDEAVTFLLETAMKIDGGSYYSFSELNSFDVMFPFEYCVSKEALMLNENRFVITTFDGQFTVSLKK